MKNNRSNIFASSRFPFGFVLALAASLFISTSCHQVQADQSPSAIVTSASALSEHGISAAASTGAANPRTFQPTPIGMWTPDLALQSPTSLSVLATPPLLLQLNIPSLSESGIFTTAGTTAGPPFVVALSPPSTSSVNTPKATVPEAPAVTPSSAWNKLLQHSASFDEGILFEHEDGTRFASVNDDQPMFNPASTTKLATSLAVLRKFGPEHTFVTEVRVSGDVSKTGELQGDLYVSGDYLLFGDRQAHELAKILNKNKIKSISGDLYVSSDFSMNLTSTGITAGSDLLKTLDPWYQKRHQGFNPRAHQAQIVIRGSVKLGPPTGDTRILVTNTSPPLRDLLKLMLAYSDNEMAARFGSMIGGPDALTAFVVHDLGVPENEVHFASTSGLYVNRVSPHAMLKILKALRTEAQSNGLQLSSLLDVAGAEKGTLHKRFTGRLARTVIAKTGTLPETDLGVSALSGEVHTKRGIFLFVIFEKHGNVAQFRTRQNMLVEQFEKDYGGPAPIAYKSFLGRIESEDRWAQ